MQNLREAIPQYRGRALAEAKERRRAALVAVCLEYLERYYMLVCFTSYLCWSRFDPDGAAHVVGFLGGGALCFFGGGSCVVSLRAVF